MTIYAKTITLKGTGMQEEALANAAGVKPGHLLYLMSTGKVAVHPTAGGNAEKMFAIEDELQGNGIDDAYAISNLVQYKIMERGSWVNAILKNGENVAIGDPLESAGNGELQKHTPDVDSAADVETIYGLGIVGYAIAAVNMSGSSGVDPSGRIAVRIA